MAPNFFMKFTLVIFALIAAASLSIRYAYASSNTDHPDSNGDGLGTISGYVVDEISYHPALDPSLLASVSFKLDSPASSVKIQLTNTQADWYDCTNTDGFQWSCETHNISLSAVNQLRVVARGN